MPSKEPTFVCNGAVEEVDRKEQKSSPKPANFGGFVESRLSSRSQVKSDSCKVELNDAKEDKVPAASKPAASKSIRHFIVITALASTFVTTYSRTLINFAITDMVYPEQCDFDTNPLGQTPINSTEDVQAFDVDGSCPVSGEVRVRLRDESKLDIKRAYSNDGEKFKWDTFKQGLLKAAYTIGHTPFQIPGSRLAEMYGARSVIGISSLIIALCCLLAPHLASIHFYMLFFDFILIGIVGSFMTPALITLSSNWLTPSEKSLMMTFYMIAGRLGYAVSSMACGLMFGAEYSWRYVFYSAGWISLLYTGLFSLSVRSRPVEHPFIKKAELDYLATKNNLVLESLAQNQVSRDQKFGRTDVQSKPKQRGKSQHNSGAPWLAIFTNVSVWSFIITKFCVKLSGDTIQIELPTYLNNAMHFSPERNGLVNAWNYVIFCVNCFAIGALAKYIMKRRPFGLGKTAIRKCFQSVASFGVAFSLLGLAFSVCDNTSTEICLMLAFFFTTFGTGGETQIPLDVSERYPGTIHAIGSSIAISGAIEPTLVGLLMRGHASDSASWRAVFLGASGIAFIGGFVFLIFADATIQPFDAVGLDEPSLETEDDVSDQKNKGLADARKGN